MCVRVCSCVFLCDPGWTGVHEREHVCVCVHEREHVCVCLFVFVCV